MKAIKVKAWLSNFIVRLQDLQVRVLFSRNIKLRGVSREGQAREYEHVQEDERRETFHWNTIIIDFFSLLSLGTFSWCAVQCFN